MQHSLLLHICYISAIILVKSHVSARGDLVYLDTGRHMYMRSHTGKKPQWYTCDVCYKGFSQSSHLSRRCQHISTSMMVTSYMSFGCQIRFIQYGHMKMHMRTHTGEKPYTCNVCHRDFVSPQICQHISASIHSQVKTPMSAMCVRRDLGNLAPWVRSHTGEKHIHVLCATRLLLVSVWLTWSILSDY